MVRVKNADPVAATARLRLMLRKNAGEADAEAARCEEIARANETAADAVVDSVWNRALDVASTAADEAASDLTRARERRSETVAEELKVLTTANALATVTLDPAANAKCDEMALTNVTDADADAVRSCRRTFRVASEAAAVAEMAFVSESARANVAAAVLVTLLVLEILRVKAEIVAVAAAVKVTSRARNSDSVAAELAASDLTIWICLISVTAAAALIARESCACLTSASAADAAALRVRASARKAVNDAEAVAENERGSWTCLISATTADAPSVRISLA